MSWSGVLIHGGPGWCCSLLRSQRAGSVWGVEPPCRLQGARHVLDQHANGPSGSWVPWEASAQGCRLGLTRLSSRCGQAVGAGRRWGWGQLLPSSSSWVVTGICESLVRGSGFDSGVDTAPGCWPVHGLSKWHLAGAPGALVLWRSSQANILGSWTLETGTCTFSCPPRRLCGPGGPAPSGPLQPKLQH